MISKCEASKRYRTDHFSACDKHHYPLWCKDECTRSGAYYICESYGDIYSLNSNTITNKFRGNAQHVIASYIEHIYEVIARLKKAECKSNFIVNIVTAGAGCGCQYFNEDTTYCRVKMERLNKKRVVKGILHVNCVACLHTA